LVVGREVAASRRYISLLSPMRTSPLPLASREQARAPVSPVTTSWVALLARSTVVSLARPLKEVPVLPVSSQSLPPWMPQMSPGLSRSVRSGVEEKPEGVGKEAGAAFTTAPGAADDT
jgi:hypothetical protein